jgi:enoyl-CoA hydratase
MGTTVTTREEGRILVVTIDRPEVRNAVDRPTAEQLEVAFREFDHDVDLDVAILTGASGTFCAGADLKGIGDGRGNRVSENMHDPGPMGCTRLDLDKPVIAAVEGHAVAGGLELALWCDLRVAASDAVFGVFCRRWGVPLIDGGTVRLPRLIGESRAMDMILTGRGVGADEALSFGLANRVCEPGGALDAALELAQQLLTFPQLCMRTDRRSAREQHGLSMLDALANETRLGFKPIKAGVTLEGAMRFADGAGRHGEGV